MLRPKYPNTPVPTGMTAPAQVVTPTAIHTAQAPSAPPAQAPAPVAAPPARLTPGSVTALVAGGAGAVLVVGTVLVSLLLAVAVTATSVAVCAVVLRSLLKNSGGVR
jgi:hypothetical protein